jgi:alanine-glyoxylate transaminase/serine-glyoxylate transaminase/serine-pyruvate transaminase
VEIDSWQVDIAYSAAQKALSGPPGLSPITVGPRAQAAISRRTAPPPVFYLDLALLGQYWGDRPTYHHTAPITTAYGLREALRLALEEGLEARWARHATNARRLWSGLEGLDLPLFVPQTLRLPTLSTPRLAGTFDEADVRSRLLHGYHIEIAGGFGPLSGKVWRIGLMGESSRPEHVLTLLAALEELLRASPRRRSAD